MATSAPIIPYWRMLPLIMFFTLDIRVTFCSWSCGA